MFLIIYRRNKLAHMILFLFLHLNTPVTQLFCFTLAVSISVSIKNMLKALSINTAGEVKKFLRNELIAKSNQAKTEANNC